MREHLREVQYRDDTNLNARYELHQRFSTNRAGFHRWLFDQLDLPGDALLLEVGCGPGYLWAANADRVPAGWWAVLTDFSPGMVEAARRRLGERHRYAIADAEALPHPDRAFHVAIANHMLYHVPDRPRAVRELARVVRPGGALYAATNGRDHMRELDQLLARWLGPGTLGVHPAAFGLENGAEQLRSAFADVELRRYDNTLEVTDPDAIVAYARSTPAGEAVDAEALRRETAAVIECDGALRVRTAVGLFVARSPIQSRS